MIPENGSRSVISEGESCHCGKLHLPFAAAAISQGAPQARQVADLWHIGKNLAESVSTLLARCRAEIRRGLHVQAEPSQEREEIEPVPEEERHSARSRSEEQARVARRAQKLDRYEQIIELHEQW